MGTYRENLMKTKPDAWKTQKIEDRRSAPKDQSRVTNLKEDPKFPVGMALMKFSERFDGK